MYKCTTEKAENLDYFADSDRKHLIFAQKSVHFPSLINANLSNKLVPMAVNLFEEFDAISLDEWREKIQKDLKGKSWDKLVWNPEPGIELQPFYRKEDLNYSQFGIDSLPGTFPFRRGNPLNATGEGWQVIQSIQLDDEEAALDRLEEAHQHEVHAFYLTRWESYPEEERLGALLEAFELHQQALHINLPVDPAFLSLDLYTLLRSRKLSPALLTGTLTNDPISRAAAQGKVAELYTFAHVEAGALNFKDSPYFRGIGLDFIYIHEQGGNMTQQIAFALGTLVEYLDWIEQSESKLTIPELLGRVAVTFAVGTHFLLEIAKLRAFRLLYAKLVQAYGIEDENLQTPFILVKTDTFHQAKYDLYNNLLRTTTEAISGILGGANAVIVQAFDDVNQPAEARSARLARNIQHLLRHESYLDKVIDPAGGSYYIEQATDALGQNAWKLFQQMEAEGGFLHWVEEGKIGERICSSAGEKAQRVEKLQEKLIGINQSPNTEEILAEPIVMDGRLASAFEEMRSHGDLLGQKLGRRLQAQLLLFGDVKMRNARAQFSRDLLGSGGLAIQEEFVSLDSMDAQAYTGDIFVLCSSDEEYLQYAETLITTLKVAHPQALFIVAGKPDNWDSLGFSHAIFTGINVLEFLRGLWSQLHDIHSPTEK